MKIVLIGPVYPYRGGIALHTTQLAIHILNAGEELKVITYKRLFPKWLYPGKSTYDPSKEPQTFPAEFILDPLNPLTWLNTIKIILQYQPDQVIAQWWTTLNAPAYSFISKALQKKSIRVRFYIHNVLPHEPKAIDQWLVKLALKTASDFIILSKREEERLKQIVDDKKPILKLSHPIYQKRKFVPKAEARSQLNLPIDSVVMLFFGLVREYKGLDVLLHAMTILKKQRPAPLLMIAGEFWDPVSKYEKIISENNLEDQVILINRYILEEEIPYIFSAADFFIAPYRGGTQSGALKLAMGYGLPVIITEIIKFDMINFHQYPHQIVRANDREELASIINKWIITPPERYESEDGTGWENLVNQLLNITKNLI